MSPAGEPRRFSAHFTIVSAAIAVIAIVALGVGFRIGGSPAEGVIRGAVSPGDSNGSTLVERAEEVLGKSVPWLPPARLVALDSGWRELPADQADSSTAMYVQFGGEAGRAWKVFVGSSAEPLDAAGCPPLGPGVVSCTTKRTAEGVTVVTSVIAAQQNLEMNVEDPPYILADVDLLTREDAPTVRFERNVRAFHPDGTMVSVTERVVAPDTLDPNRAFISPIDDLMELATDGSLALP